MAFNLKYRRKALFGLIRCDLLGSVSPVGEVKREPNRRTPADIESCLHDDIDFAKVCVIIGGGISQEEEYDPPSSVYLKRKRNYVKRITTWGSTLRRAATPSVFTVGRDEAVVYADTRICRSRSEKIVGLIT